MSREELWQLVRQDIKVGWLWGIKRENLEPTSVVRIDATGYSSLPRSLAVYCGAVRVELTFARSAWVDELPHHRPTLVAEYAVAYQW